MYQSLEDGRNFGREQALPAVMDGNPRHRYLMYLVALTLVGGIFAVLVRQHENLKPNEQKLLQHENLKPNDKKILMSTPSVDNVQLSPALEAIISSEYGKIALPPTSYFSALHTSKRAKSASSDNLTKELKFDNKPPMIAVGKLGLDLEAITQPPVYERDGFSKHSIDQHVEVSAKVSDIVPNSKLKQEIVDAVLERQQINVSKVQATQKFVPDTESNSPVSSNINAQKLEDKGVDFDERAHLPNYKMKTYSESHRTPENGIHHGTNLFSHPKVIEAFENVKLTWVHDDDVDNPLNQLSVKEKKAYAVKHVKEQCFGSDNEDTIDVWIDEKLMQNDLLHYAGYTVFNLDCRDFNSNPLIALILVMDMYGQVIAVHHPPWRAECVTMYDTETVLFSLINGAGIWKWNWKRDTVEKTKVLGDAHTIQYDHSRKMYWGLRKAAHFDPSIALGWDEEGNVVWEHALEGGSHINFVTIGGDSVYFSLRSAAAIRQVSIESKEEMKDIGGLWSNVKIMDREGGIHPNLPNSLRDQTAKKNIPKGFEWTGPWYRQHKGQHLSDKYYSLFDNHVDSDNEHFLDDGNSAMVVLDYDEDQEFVTEVFRFDTGDKSKIYGSADVLPSGNVLGNSYPNFVQPSVPDRQYHVNIWEANIFGEIAWRMSFKGRNPWDPTNFVDDYSHSVSPEEEAPVGWIIYNTERIYEAPIVNTPCIGTVGRKNFLQFLPFNTVRTQTNMPGTAQVVNTATKEIIAETQFEFQKSWLPSAVMIPISEDQLKLTVSLVIKNGWGDSRTISFSSLFEMQRCESLEQKRLFT